ncbi:hypothetical protein FGK63_04580 [Ruegeria sediminis]|uniref:O-antigen ligase domain-containing protein n=1 Tax=Ruegeria sediminis TaxID=2583820 RepID=A0ABY2X4M1_9RHOB|nr:hypothetical protein [Ruegeria sediminis]TMV10340.1 hypothetical protein FGK63_04580 [Ruegeria sediminis]
MRVATAKSASSGLTISATGLLAFAAGALSTTTINLVGNLYLSEIIALVAVVIANSRTTLHWNSHQTVIISGLILILLGLVISDTINSTAPNDMLRGWANPLFAIIGILFLTDLFTRNERAILLWLGGSALAHVFVIDQYQLSEVLAGSNGFKARVAPILIPAILIFSPFMARFGKDANLFLFTVVGLTFVLLGARSSGLFFMATAAVLSMMRLKRGGHRYVFAGVLLALGYVLYLVYVDYILKSGQISNSLDQFSRSANPYNPFELIRQGRSEFFVALTAIRDAPLFGHGSWAQDTAGTYSELLALIKGRTNVYYSSIIVSHSVLLTTWMWGGIIAFAGALMLYVPPARRAVAVSPHLPPRWRPILVFLLLEISWHYLFSPFGHIRTSFPFFIATTIALSQRYLPDWKRP